jgi:UDP-N-acetylmuramoylalanine--D-glutamate ligase
MTPHVYPKGCFFKSLDDIKDKKVTIMGLGLNGGGEACVRFFSRYGAYITVTDKKTEEELAPTLNSLRQDPAVDFSRIKLVLGKHELSDFQSADCVIKNPGVKFEGNEYLAAAKSIESDISLFLSFTKAPIIAVSGSKGKSSTVSAIHYGLCQAGFKAFLGGNITVSPLTFLEQTDETTPVVLELSSWQLADLRGRGVLKPKISVLTKIVPDHQNWYGGMEPYVADKKLIYADQTPDCFTLCNADDDWGKVFAAETKAKVVWYGENADMPVRVTDAIVPGVHMKQNLTNAAIVMTLMGVAPQSAKEILAAYPGIEHRLEYFYSWNLPASAEFAASPASCGAPAEFRFYNDTTATVPDAAAAALEAFNEKPVLFAGGNDKNLDFTPFAAAAHKAAAIYLLEGKGTDHMIPLLNERGIAFSGPFSSLASLLEAFKNDVFAGKICAGKSPAVNVVFSPGATSFGMFANEFDRGRQFKNLVKELFA